MEANFRSGDELSAETLNQIVRDQAIEVRGSGGVSIRSAGPRSIAITQKFTGAFVGVASGDITARVGGALGIGDVELWVVDTSSGDYVDSGILLEDCDNLSSTTGGIPSGTWVAGFFTDSGGPLIMTADCGN
jgi:hypothetical protein